jgi:membrane protein YqaA with SNARE-associated domain
MSLTSESAWFAALEFGGYNMALATLAAFVGSVLGMSINFGFGYYISRWRSDAPVYSEAVYSRISAFFNTYLCWLMAIPPLFILELMPGISLFAVVCGLFRVKPLKAIGAIAIARAAYYTYYLMQSANVL